MSRNFSSSFQRFSLFSNSRLILKLTRIALRKFDEAQLSDPILIRRDNRMAEFLLRYPKVFEINEVHVRLEDP